MEEIKTILKKKEIERIFDEYGWSFGNDSSMYVSVGRAIEAAVLSANAGKVDADPPVIIGADGIVWANIYFNWAQDKCGFGEWSCVVKDGEVKELLNEGMGSEWSRKALYAMSDALIEKIFPTQQASDAAMQASQLPQD